MYSAILFDLDNTLIDRDRAFQDFVRATFGPCEEIVEELVAIDRSGYGDRSQLFARWQALGGGELDSQRFGTAIANFVLPQTDLNDALVELNQVCEIGVITNGSVAAQCAKWRNAKLSDIVRRDRLWISAEVGIAKPDAKIFHLACEAIGSSPDCTLYIGDQPEIDIVGARGAGLQTMLVESPLNGETIKQLAAGWQLTVKT